MVLGFDTLVVFGYGPVERDGRLNVYARLAALAAETLLRQGATKRLLVTGGRTGGDDLPSEAALLADHLTRRFGASPAQLVLEERARDTIDNLIFSANMLDVEGRADDRLGFLALRLHGPRISIRYLADLVGLTGTFVALEGIIAERSERHRRFLEDLSRTPSYARLAASQARAMRGMAQLPDFWLPPLGGLENPERLRRLQKHPAVSRLGFPEDLTMFRDALDNRPRRYPEPHPDDMQRGLEAARG